METKYALLNPATGEYDYFATEEEVKLKLAERALEFYISHSHGVAYHIVAVDENGWETWEATSAIKEINTTETTQVIQEQMV
jgi:hypothetical protein